MINSIVNEIIGSVWSMMTVAYRTPFPLDYSKISLARKNQNNKVMKISTVNEISNKTVNHFHA